MSREKPESDKERRHWRTVEILKRALANAELMEATHEGVAASLRGEKGVPLKQVQEEARRRHEAQGE
jgi:hypothetical protein